MTQQPPVDGIPQARKQNVSCDACKFRKVKCDRRAKLESKQVEEKSESNNSISCSVCNSHGLRCTFTQPTTLKKSTRNGRRIIAYQQSIIDKGIGTSMSASSSSNSISSTQAGSPLMNDASSSTSKSSMSDMPYLITTSEGLFDVKGLTQPLLDACFQGFMNYYAPCIFGLQIETLAARYKLFLSTLQQNRGFLEPYWTMSPNDCTDQDRPISEILILAMGCIGASLLQPPVAEPGSNAKFRLQDRFALKFQQRLQNDLARRLKHEGTDVVEACYIMADPFLSVIGNAHGANASPDPFRIRPATPEGITRLLSRLGITRRPTLKSNCPLGDCRIWQSNGQVISEMELFRQMRLFWTVFLQNAFRSMGDKTNSLIASEDFDWDLPRFIPRQDGSYDSLIYCEREHHQTKVKSRIKDIVCLQANHFVEFDVVQFQVMLRLALIIRTVSTKLASVRSQGRSALISDVERAIHALSAWYQQLPAEVTWEVQIEALQQICTNGSDKNEVAMQYAIKAFFVETLYHANVWTVWDSIERFGTRVDLDMTETTTAQLADGLHIGSDSHVIEGIEGQQEEVDHGESEAFRNRLYNLTAKSFVRISKISKEAAQLNLVRASRLVFAHVFRMYAKWGCNLAVKLSAKRKVEFDVSASTSSALPINFPPGWSEIDYIFKCVDDLIFALAAIDSCEQAKGMAFGLKKEVQESKEKIQFNFLDEVNLQSSDNMPLPSELQSVEGYKFEALASSFHTAEDTSIQFDLNSLAPADLEWLSQYLEQQQTDKNINQKGSTGKEDDHAQWNENNANTTTHLELASPSAEQTENHLFNSFFNESDTYIDSIMNLSSQSDQMSHFFASLDAQNWTNDSWQQGVIEST